MHDNNSRNQVDLLFQRSALLHAELPEKVVNHNRGMINRDHYLFMGN